LLNILIPANRGDKKRLLIDVLIAAAVFAGYFWYTHWAPAHKMESEHYKALSNASVEDTLDALEKAEALYRAYTAFWDVAPKSGGRKLLLKIYSSRKEFKRANPFSGWAEAFYKEPYCHQYVESDSESRPYHWMVHEATHQLNNEVSQLKLPKWAEEGIASYFSTSSISDGKMLLGVIDRDTYPIWWLSSLALSGDLARDKAEQKIVSLRSIVNDEKPLAMDEHVNLYYIHWFSLTHFLLEGEQRRYRQAFVECVKTPSGLEAFEEDIGPYQVVEPQWYRHLLGMIVINQ
jgi:hypothetical protein